MVDRVVVAPGQRVTIMLADAKLDADGIRGTPVSTGMGTAPSEGRPLPVGLVYDGKGYVSDPSFVPRGRRVIGAMCVLILEGAVSAAYCVWGS